MEVKKIVSNILESITYVVNLNGNSIIVDCGAELELVKKAVGENKVVAILLTHEHYDHMFYVNSYEKAFNCPIYGTEETINFVKNPVWNFNEELPRLNEFEVKYSTNFTVLSNNQTLQIANFSIQTIYAPGHSLGACCYIINGNIFTGDVLFSTGIGRYDMIENGKDLTIKSLEILQNVKGYENVYCGHGEESNFARQQKNIRLFKALLQKKN